MKKIFGIAVLAGVLLASFGISKLSNAKAPAHQETAQKYQVKIDNFSFGPPALTVPVGSTVTWTNQDDVPHNVVSSEGKTLKSPVLDTGQTFSYTFTQKGTYPYFCGIHPRMTGKVVVQ